MKKIASALMVCVAVSLLSGCYSTRYAWNNYNTRLYDYYANTINDQTYTEVLLGAVSAASSSHKKVAPGLYAELGTAYMRQGDLKRAREYYALERESWPESRLLMTALIDNIDRMENKPKQGAAQ